MTQNGSEILLFCKGLPAETARLLFNSYKNEERELDYLYNRSRVKSAKGDLRTTKLLLAIAIFYRIVVLPLRSSADFSTLIFKSNQVGQIRFGSYTFTHSRARVVSAHLTRFQNILSLYDLPESLLQYKTISEFIKNLNERFH